MTDVKNYMALCSEKTLQSNKKGFFMQFAQSVQESAGKEWIHGVFGKLKTDRDRIRMIYRDSKVKDPVIATLSHVQEIYRKKSGEVSFARRFDAQKAVQQDEKTKALTLLSQAILRAPKTGENTEVDSGLSLCQGLWARSDVLMGMHRYYFAMQDLQLALKEGLPERYKAEAFWRLAICYRALNEEKKCYVYESLRKEHVNAKYANRRRLDIWRNEHPELRGASAKLTIKHATGKGRFVVAREDLSTGELIVQEEAYASCLLSDFFGTHCHHCYNRLEAPVGCPDCSSVAFCGVECRNIALATYHKYECHFLDLLIGSGMSILAHVALRMVTQKPIEYFLQVHQDIEQGIGKGVYNLCTLNEYRAPEDFLHRTLMASFLLRCLQRCGYFGYVDDKVVPNENQFKIGEILLYNLQMLQFNAHEIYETRLTKNHRFQGAIANYIAVGVYSSASMFNHSCTPSVTRHFVGKHIVLRAAKPIKAGEEICDNYGPNYSRKSLDERRKYLKARYLFDCKCIACIQDWPKLDALDTIDTRVKCPHANGTDKENNPSGTVCDYFFTVPVKNEKGKCPRCKNKVNLGPVVELYNKVEQLYEKAFACMDTDKVEEGIVLCRQGLDLFYTISAPPHKTTQMAEECLRALYADSGNMWDIPTTPNPAPAKVLPRSALRTNATYASTVKKSAPNQAGSAASSNVLTSSNASANVNAKAAACKQPQPQQNRGPIKNKKRSK